jgi:hypothetical protein
MPRTIRHSVSNPARAGSVVLVVLALVGCGPGNSDLALGQERVDPAEAEYAARMIDAIRAISLTRAAEDNPVARFNQVKTLACHHATFTVGPGLAADLRQGIFATERSYPALLRFANATEQDDTKQDFRGLSIKLKDVAGEPLWGAPGQQDFLLNSYPVLFAADPADFLAFIEATRDDALWRYFIDPRHFYSLWIVLMGREKIADPFEITYWSTTPYRLGPDETRAVKYSVRACPGPAPAVDVPASADFLADAMRAHLAVAPACFDFLVQPQTDPDAMPIEDASALWNEADSPFIPVARIEIPAGSPSVDCEDATFNPWQSLAAHRPLGGINRTRLPVYAEIGQFRLRENADRRSD